MREWSSMGEDRWSVDEAWTLLKECRSTLAVVLAVLLTAVTTLSFTVRAAEGVAAETAAIGELGGELERAAVPAVDAGMVERQARRALVQRVRANWREPTGVQPNLADYPDITVDVSLADQMVYVRSAGTEIYRMVASTGIDDSTPHGTFVTNGDRDDHFYTARDHMGGDYWTRITGVYLFHSVPTREDAGDYIEDQAVLLGEPASHGCVRLTVADAKWVYEQLPKGTRVTIS
ncbi:peptidase [Bifidobacterium sp. DSM 109958]|uniref:Peptidase n=1 Tax=Bifidobacterium moraviense TaxID=2675323 RepID=A0A7Y0HY87_9BIFI|nr:L,D-transpeptidase [Bifidobacterium sp. DSM 109958]NMM99498.1 peptidase [Bifidobacterium sp. DSM 109958]